MNALVLTASTKTDLKDPLEHKKKPFVVVYFDDILIHKCLRILFLQGFHIHPGYKKERRFQK
jgi:hypothetical protein